MNEDKKMIELGFLSKGFKQTNRVLSTEGICNCLDTMQGGNREPKVLVSYIVAMRGRNPDHPTDRTPGIPTEQRLEPNFEGVSNTLTTVHKDNLVMEKLKIKQATEQGYIEMELGGVFDGSYPQSTTRRGRVQEGGTVSPTLTAQSNELYRVEDVVNYRIRKLTPTECFRLMGVSDEDADKMKAVNSNTQLYKQAGNSIVVDVMARMFEKLF